VTLLRAALLSLFVGLAPQTVLAAWVFVPDNMLYDPIKAKSAKVRIYNAGIKTDVFFPAPTFNAVTGAQNPYQDFVIDPLTSTLVPLSQTQIVNYGLVQPQGFLNGGSILAGVNETAIADTFTSTAPWILWAYLTGWLVALPLALMLNFARGRLNSSV